MIKPVSVTRTLCYNPKAYLDYCEKWGDEPTQNGFVEFIEDEIEEDFTQGFGDETITILDQ